MRTADPAKRGVPLSAFPRIVPLGPNVYGYEEIRQPGFTTVSMFVVGRNGVLLADGQGSAAATQTMLDRIKTVEPATRGEHVVVLKDGRKLSLTRGVREVQQRLESL